MAAFYLKIKLRLCPRDLATPTEPRLVNVWNQAQDNFKRTLSTSQYQKFLAVGNSEQLLQEVSNLNITYRKRLIPRVLSRLDPFFQQLKLFGQTITILIQSNPRITSVIWGSIYALLEVRTLIIGRMPHADIHPRSFPN